jgi:aromatic-L-amino-acid decarboxylase
VLVALLAARAQAIKKLKKKSPNADEGVLLSKLMAYCSKEAHSCLEKGAMIAFVKLRILEPDENFSLQGSTVRRVRDLKLYFVSNFVPTKTPKNI